MHKKIFSIFVLALAISSVNIFAIGIGAQAGYVAGPNHTNGAITFKLDTSPWVIALNVDGISSNYLGLGITADVWVANKTIEAPFSYYYGWGLAGSLGFVNEHYTRLFLGVRALVGVNAFIVDNFLELYAQIAWQPGVNLHLADNSGFGLVAISFPINIGFRFWI